MGGQELLKFSSTCQSFSAPDSPPASDSNNVPEGTYPHNIYAPASDSNNVPEGTYPHNIYAPDSNI